MSVLRDSESQRLVGGEVCLDFANTINGHRRLTHLEYLQDYRDLVLWGRHAGVINSFEAERLLKKAGENQADAQAVYRFGLDLRETIFDIFSAMAGGRKAKPGDLERLSAAWREHIGHTRLVKSSSGYNLGWDEERYFELPLRSVTASAIRLLTSPEIHQVRQCAGEGCDWLFVDASRNHLRKWCSMEECGNRAKMKRRKLKLNPEGKR